MDGPRDTLQRLLDALLHQDFRRMQSLLAPSLEFRALVPRGPVSADTAADAAERFRFWFGDVSGLRLLDCLVDGVHDRWRLSYRLAGREQGEAFVVEQQAYCEVAGGLVTWMHLLCSGFRRLERPVSARVETVSDDAACPRLHRFEAGDLGCGTGLPAEFRRRLTALPPGEALQVVTRDPSAREDLPALARLLGQRVLSSAAASDGSTVIVVERVR